MRTFLRFLGFLLLAGAAASAAEIENPSAVFREANRAYREGDYGRATRLYQSLVDKQWNSADVFYNVANAHFREKHLGLAILNYEKAKRFRPRDRDVRANLAYATGLIEYRVEDKRNWYVRTVNAFLASFTREELGVLTLGFGLVFWGVWGFCLYLGPGLSWGWGRKTLLGFFLFSVFLWVSKEVQLATLREAIILKSQAAVRYGPSHKDQVAFRLGEGIKVRIKKKSGDWSWIVLKNGESGWMLDEEIGGV